MKKPFVNPDNTKQRPDETYGRVIDQIKKDRVCPFCPENLKTYHKNPILKEGTYWLLTNNMYPYKGAKHHILMIHKEHIESVTEISGPAWNELQEFIVWVIKNRNIGGGSLVLRFGDTTYTGSSVSHLHANIISSDGKPDREPILARIG